MKKKLLLADDSITIQKVVGIIFAPEDYELLTVSDGDKAYDLALAHKPDLVIADITMPGKNGFELCRAIKSHPALGTTSVLLLPGAFEAFDETRAMEVCADGWLTKPFESQALIDKVTALVEMPPLRLVAAVEAEAADQAEDEMGEITSATSLSAMETDTPLGVEEDDFFATEEPVADRTDEVGEPSGMTEDPDSELWGEVSFEEDDLKPQELLAASDQDEEESTDYLAEEDDLSETAQGLTPEQLAPYVTTPPPTVPADDFDTPDFEPLPATGQNFQFITDLSEDEDEVAVEESGFSAAVDRDEPGIPVDFAAQHTLENGNSIEGTTVDNDELLELMEEDLDPEEELVEDSATFIDLTAADEDVAEEETPADEEFFTIQAEEDTVDDEILELTEGDVIEEDGVAFDASPEETQQFQAPIDEHYTLDDPLEQVTEEDEATEVLFGRRDDDLFADDVETGAVTAMTEDTVDSVDAEFEADLDEELEEEKPEEVEEFYAFAAEPDRFEEPVTVPPIVSAATTPSAGMVEEQLRQLPEEAIEQIVEKVAGPLIERLAREMLEQVVWEVVPDLAETMISAEIDKIKRGEV